MKGFARFRHMQEVSEMGKPDDHPLRDVTIIQSCGKLIGDSSSSEKPVLLFDLNTVEGEYELDDNELPSKKQKLNEVESHSMNGFGNNSQVNLEPSMALLGSNTKNGGHKDPSSPSQKEVNLGLSSESELDRSSTLILRSCLNCYLHVLVCDDNPKCPKCKKGDSLLDMFRESLGKKESIV